MEILKDYEMDHWVGNQTAYWIDVGNKEGRKEVVNYLFLGYKTKLQNSTISCKKHRKVSSRNHSINIYINLKTKYTK